jgi:hypothetical protein
MLVHESLDNWASTGGSGLAVSITPKVPVPLFGRAARLDLFNSVAGELEANVITLPAPSGILILIGLDTLFPSDRLKKAVIAKLPPNEKARIAEFVFIATHTHNAPALDPSKPRLGLLDEGYLEAVGSTLAAAVSRVMQKRPPPHSLHLSRGTSTCTLNSLRRKAGIRIQPRPPYIRVAMNSVPVHTAKVPRDLQIIIGHDAAGVPQWAIWHWCCHATSAPGTNMVSADFPGHVRAVLRARLDQPMLPVVYLPGFCGDIRPDPSVLPLRLRSLVMTPLQRPFARATPQNFARLCTALTHGVDVALSTRKSLGVVQTAKVVRASIKLSDLIAASPPVEGSMDIVAIDSGPLGLLLMGAEVCSPYLDKLAPLVPEGWLLSGYSDYSFGYLPDDCQIAEGGYEGGEFFEVFGLDGCFRPRIEARIIETVRSTVGRTRALA